MILFKDLATKETIELETYEIDTIEWKAEGIYVKDTNGNEYLTKIIEPQ